MWCGMLGACPEMARHGLPNTPATPRSKTSWSHAPDVHISTVYRHLEELGRLSVIDCTRMGEGPATYHLASAGHGQPRLHRTASATVATTWLPGGSGGRCTITTCTPSSRAACSFAAVIGPPLFFVTSSPT
jgi:hypothetical protein